MNEKWGDGCVSLTITDQYKNMAEIIKDCPHLIENTKKPARWQALLLWFFQSVEVQMAVS